MTKTQVCPVTGSSQAVAPDTTGAFDGGLMDLSCAHTSTHPVVNLRMAKLPPRQQVSAFELVSLADSVPSRGWDVAVASDEFEFTNCADE